MPGEGSPFDVPPAAFGRFRVLHQIGAGSAGPVFRGEDTNSGESVAIKLLQLNLPRQRANRVADSLRDLATRIPRLPALAYIIGSGLHQGDPYYVTPFVPGDSLDVALREYGPAAMVDFVPRLRAVANALDLAAEAGVWHGALHPRDLSVWAEVTMLTGLAI